MGQRGGPEFFEGQGGGDQNFFSNFFLRLRRSSFLDTLFKKNSRLLRNLFLFHTSWHITCSHIITFFSQPPWHWHSLIWSLPPYLFMRGDVLSPLGGDQNFFTRSKGGTKISCRRQRGGPKFFAVGKGGDQKKLATGHHRQTAPPVKNDSSLMSFFFWIPCWFTLKLYYLDFMSSWRNGLIIQHGNPSGYNMLGTLYFLHSLDFSSTHFEAILYLMKPVILFVLYVLMA